MPKQQQLPKSGGTTSGTTKTAHDLEAFSQVSRFHAETLTPGNKEVDLKGVNISVGPKDLLVDAHLRLKENTRYVLLGRNGTGKSTLLRSIGQRSLIGFPKHVSVLYVHQELAGDDRSVLQTVLDADIKKRRMHDEIHVLERAVAEGPAVLTKVVHDVLTARAADDSQDAAAVAAHRSRRRGKQSRMKAIEAEALARQVKNTHLDNEEAMSRAQTMLTELYEEMSMLDADADEALAATILSGLGFSPEQQKNPTTLLSGGWRMRAALASALYANPDLLLLDEPTNHLDLKATIWLQEYLKSRTNQNVVVVSHDRAFMNAVSEVIVLLLDKQLTYYPGDFDTFKEARDEKQRHKAGMIDALERKKKHIQESIQKSERAAVESGDDKRLGLVASRRKKLDRLGMEKTEEGHKFKQSYWAGFHDTARPQIMLEKTQEPISFRFPEPPQLHYHGPLLQLRNADFAYSKNAPNILHSVVLDIDMSSRIGLMGINGSGKSTLLKLVTGEVAPTKGSVERFHGLKIGCVSQHSMSTLGQRKGTALEALQGRSPAIDEQELRNYLGSMNVKGGIAVQELETLSGGQRTRVALALVLWERPHVVLLDEPTNHLDYESIEALAAAIKSFQGGVVIVSHDARFIKDTCEQLYLVRKGTVESYAGDVGSYVERLTRLALKSLSL